MSRGTAGGSDVNNSPPNEVIEGLKRKRTALLGDEVIPERAVVRKASRLVGEIAAPPSKSYSHRALMVAGLSPVTTIVHNPLISDDIFATIEAWQTLGTRMRYDEANNDVHVHGVEKPFTGGTPSAIYVKESGTTLRFLLPGLAFANGLVRVEGEMSLRSRPNSFVVEPLRKLGLTIEGQAPGDSVPISVRATGSLPTGEVHISGGTSSQVLSAFLLWLPLATPSPNGFSTIHAAGKLVSKPYVDVTLDVLNWAGVRIEALESDSIYRIPGNQKFAPSTSTFSVNGDYSSAAFLLVAASLIESNVLIKGLKADKQGDRAIIKILKRMGSNIDDSLPDGIRVRGAAPLRGIELDCSDIPDLVPILCVLGLFAEGPTVLKNISHLRFKESDRLKGPVEELRLLGAQIAHTEDSIVIHKSKLVSNRVSARGDHRLAMALIVAGLAGAGAEIDGATSIKKSYPWFIRHMRSLGAEILG